MFVTIKKFTNTLRISTSESALASTDSLRLIHSGGFTSADSLALIQTSIQREKSFTKDNECLTSRLSAGWTGALLANRPNHRDRSELPSYYCASM